jgi:ATP-dependent RNA helicase DDX31/DBP7
MFMKWPPKVTVQFFVLFVCNFYGKLSFVGYVSFVRSYAALPKDVRDVFNFQSLHLGHYAKSFALRDPPAQINTNGRMGQRNDRIQPFNTARQRNPALLKRAAAQALG